MKIKYLCFLVLPLLSFFSCTQNQQKETTVAEKEATLKFVSVHPTPIIGKNSPGAEDNKFGFEGGTSMKVNGTYYLFTTEAFDQPKTAATRLALWSSKDGLSFQRQTTITSTNYNWNDTTNKMSPWSPMAVYDEDRGVWSLFHVGYRRKANSSNVFNMTGRIFRYDSETKGKDGIAGPYKNGEWLKIDDTPDWFEGPGKIVSFYPYRVGHEWWAFYGANSVPDHVDANGTVNPNAKNVFYAGLAKSEGGLTDKWVRQKELNPVKINPEFIENSVVTKVAPNLYISLYDGAKKDQIAYATSPDGITWSKEKIIQLENKPSWIKHMRTPQGLIDEGDGLYSIYFTSFDGQNPDKVEPLWHDGFGNVGRVQVKLEMK